MSENEDEVKMSWLSLQTNGLSWYYSHNSLFPLVYHFYLIGNRISNGSQDNLLLVSSGKVVLNSKFLDFLSRTFFFYLLRSALYHLVDVK